MKNNTINIIDDSGLVKPEEGTKFILTNNNKKYILNIQKCNDDSILFNLNLNKEICKNYYELKYKFKLLTKLSKLFIFCTNVDESYNLLIDNLTKNEENIKLDFENKNAKISFQLNLPTKKKQNVFVILEKKEININTIIEKLNKKLNNIEENQKNLEKNIENKFKEINDISNKQNNFENKIKQNEQIKKIHDEFEEKNKKLIDKINIIEKNNETLIIDIKGIKKPENGGKIGGEVGKILVNYPEIEIKIESIKDYQEKVEKNLNENDKLKEIKKKY